MSQKIGEHYEVIRELRRGAWVTVIEARHTILGRRTLIKWLNPAFREDAELVGRLRREARLGASVDHPNVARIFEISEAEERLYVATEWIEGEDLEQLLEREGALPVERALRLASDLLAGLDAIHSVGVVHRDLSPMNVRVTPDGVARITDFGLATGPFDTHYTLPGSVVGTPGYLSPEQASGKQVDERSDLFSCGILIHEALTGQPLFRDDDLIATLKGVRHHTPPSVEGSIPGLPEGFDNWLAGLLAKKTEDRFVSAKSALDALEPMLLESRVKEVGGTTRPAARRKKRARLTLAIAALLVLGLLLLLPGYLGRDNGPAELLDADSLADDILPDTTTRMGEPLEREANSGEGQQIVGVRDRRSEQESMGLRTPRTVDQRDDALIEEEGVGDSTLSPSPESVEQGVTAQSGRGFLLIRTHPWAEVYLEALRVGATPGLPLLECEAGLVRLTFDNPGFPPIPLQVNVAARETTEVQVALIDHVAAITLAAQPWAKVYLDDSPLGETPLTRILHLSPGQHVIRFSHPEFGDVVREVAAEPGMEMTISVDMRKEGTGFAPVNGGETH